MLESPRLCQVKKDCIAGLDDTADFASVGGRRDGKGGQKLDIGKLWGTSLCIGRSGDAFERRVEGGYTEDCWSCGLGDSGVDLITDNIVGRTGSSAGSAVTLRLGIVALRWSISISDEDGVLRRPELGFDIPLFAIYVDKDRIFRRPKPG